MSAKGLTSKEMRKLSHAAVDLYQATSQPALGYQVHMLMKSICTVDHAAYVSIDLPKRSAIAAYSHPDILPLISMAVPVYDHYVKTYPKTWSYILTARHQGKVLRIRDTVPRSVTFPAGFIEEYAQPTFSEYQLCYYVRSPGHFVGITCNRNGREFSDKEKAVVEFLAPHLQAAYENCLAFEANASLIARAAAAQRVAPQQMIWLNQDLAVLEITPRIPQLLMEFFGEEISSNRLPLNLTNWLREPTASDPAEALRPMIVRRSNASLTIRFYPQQLPGLHLLTFHRQSITPTLDDLKPFGLSRRESEVLLWLAQGKTNAEISRILYINRRTVDGHVQAILAKLGVENRTAASLLVADLLHG